MNNSLDPDRTARDLCRESARRVRAQVHDSRAAARQENRAESRVGALQANCFLQLSLNSNIFQAVKETPPSTSPETPFVCPLTQVRVGVACRIKQLSASPELTRRLRELGFCEEQRIKLLGQHAGVICQVCNVRLGISPELAEEIWVEPIQAESPESLVA